MLVFFSDIHLTDGTSGETINAGAFDIFADQVAELARKRKAKEVRLVLLGDGLDVIRSARWLDDPKGPRPWTEDPWAPRGPTEEILKATLDANRKALDFLVELPQRVANQTQGRVPAEHVQLDYVLGNHDWLINRYDSTRKLVAERLNLPASYTEKFPAEFVSPPDAYDVVARHGDIFDRLNFDKTAGRDASSLGDAIVIELLNSFPQEVAQQLGESEDDQKILRRLKELDNVRPLTLVPGWVVENVARLKRTHPGVSGIVQRALRNCVDRFVQTDAYERFRRSQLTRSQRVLLRMALDQVKRQKAGVLDLWMQRAVPALKALEPLLKKNSVLSKLLPLDYAACAQKERYPNGRRPTFVVYGHTHHLATVPLGSSDSEDRGRFYLNSGTWRTVWEQGHATSGPRHFDAWKVMSYVIIYRPDEGGGKHEFEIWTGSLRDRRGIAPKD